jgi:hypothetical protein
MAPGTQADQVAHPGYPGPAVVDGKRSLPCPKLTATLATPSVTVKDLFAEAAKISEVSACAGGAGRARSVVPCNGAATRAPQGTLRRFPAHFTSPAVCFERRQWRKFRKTAWLRFLYHDNKHYRVLFEITIAM